MEEWTIEKRIIFNISKDNSGFRDLITKDVLFSFGII